MYMYLRARIWFRAIYEYDNTTFIGDMGQIFVNRVPLVWSITAVIARGGILLLKKKARANPEESARSNLNHSVVHTAMRAMRFISYII